METKRKTTMEAEIVLCDIEGTTTSISFVKDVLFPYVRENVEKYLEDTWDDEQTKQDVEALRAQWKEDEQANLNGAVPIPDGHDEETRGACVKSVLWQMDIDRKATALKQLQGHMWLAAYQSGQVKGHVYPDVKPAMEAWCKAGLQVHIYSSGSVAAQKLLFKYSVEGDMTPLLSGHYDTTTGGKMDSSSYTTIAQLAGVSPSAIVFLSDRIEECRAARDAGLQVVVSIRPGNTPISDEDLQGFQTLTSFSDIIVKPCEDKPAKTAKQEFKSSDQEA
eukprot:m.15821 g.15821  ORF g.15821 m.15821 type:complete len:277 (-) comp7934_c0_seq1:52-882(-)